MKNIRRLLVIPLIVVGAMSLTGCNFFTREFGGTSEEDLPAGKKLVNASWKEGSDIWYLTRDMKDGEEAETYEYIESSNMGIAQGKVIIHEHKK